MSTQAISLKLQAIGASPGMAVGRAFVLDRRRVRTPKLQARPPGGGARADAVQDRHRPVRAPAAGAQEPARAERRQGPRAHPRGPPADAARPDAGRRGATSSSPRTRSTPSGRSAGSPGRSSTSSTRSPTSTSASAAPTWTSSPTGSSATCSARWWTWRRRCPRARSSSPTTSRRPTRRCWPAPGGWRPSSPTWAAQTSHTAIVARARSTPAVVGAGRVSEQISPGDVVAVDGVARAPAG